MKRQPILFRILLALLLAVPLVSRAQNSAFESLWAVYEAIPHNYGPSVCVAQLDTIEQMAVREKDAYQHFRVQWERVYLDNMAGAASFQNMLLRIDSLRKTDVATQWNAPNPELYRALYHYLSGMVLMTASSSANPTLSNTQNTDIQWLDEWTKEDFRNTAKERFRTCFDQMPPEIEYSNREWGFLTTNDAVWTVFTPTLYDVLVQNCLDYFYKDKEMVEYLIEKVLNTPPYVNYQTVKLHFELLWLAHLYDLPDYPVDSSEYWKNLDWLEEIYGPNEAFDYTRGVLLYSACQQTDVKNDYPARALKYFNHVMRDGEIAYYRQNASYYIERLTLPQIELTDAQYDLPPGHKLRIPITYANIDTLYVTVYRDDHDCRLSFTGYNYWEGTNRQTKGTYSKQWYSHSEEPVHTQRFILETHGKNLSYTTELWLDSLPQGHYELFFHLHPEMDSIGALMKTAFCVNRLKVSTWTEANKHYIAVNDFNTGKPISWRSVNVPWKMTRFTNRFGEIRYQRVLFWSTNPTKIHDKNTKYNYFHNPDHYSWWNNMGFRRYAHRRMKECFGRLFTDRRLYRPGQTAHFKFVLYNGKGKLIPNQEVLVQLREYNYPYAVIDSMPLTTNEFGSVAGEFKMPDKIGIYGIALIYKDESISLWENDKISVAEYKLPSFKVKLLKDTAQTATGDTLTIRGRVTALSGYPVCDADVALNVKYIETEQFNLYTDEDGYFTYRYAVPRSSVEIPLNIEAVVTDLNGETHQDNMRVIVPPKLLNIQVDYEKDFDLSAQDTMSLTVQALNFENIPQEVPLRVTIMRLQSPENYRVPVLEKKPMRWEPHYSREEYAQEFPHVTWDLNERSYSYWPVAETVFTTERLFCPDSLLLIDVHNWKTGDYKLLVEGVDKRGNPVKEERHFTVNHSSSTDFNAYMPIRIAFQKYPERTGDKMTLSLGSCLQDAVMICDVYQGGKRLKTLRIPLNHEQKLVTVKTRRNNDRHIYVLARIVQNGELHFKNINYLIDLDSKTKESIIRYLQDKTLTAELTHYHNVVEPGSNEEWEITIQDGNKNAAKEVEMLAWMMDGSLYELGMKEPNYKLNPRAGSPVPKSFRKKMQTTIWRSQCEDLSLAYPSYITFRQETRRFLKGPYEKIRPLYNYSAMGYYGTGSGELSEVVFSYVPPVFSMDKTPASGGDIRSALSDLAGVSSVDGTMTSVRGNRSDGQQTIIDGMRVRGDVQVVETVEEASPEVKERPALSPSSDIRVRTNFTETAFFYPQLRTDEQGRVKIRFTLPDQYTNWQFFATGHNKQLVPCELTAFLQSRRSFMLQSNAPRFLREGDTLDFAAKVVNISEKEVRGEVTLQFFNAEDNQPIRMILGDDTQPFDVNANASREVHFRLMVPEGVTAVTYRIVARCTDSAAVAGDGEENILPVLPNRVLITEAQHFVVPARTDTAFTFQRYRTAKTPTLRPMSYTMEVTANPAWLAIYALPSLMRYPYECNEQLFSKLFAAAVVRHALKQNPELEDIFERWRSDTLNGSLESPMLKNETLRNILLEETPWLSSAQSESKQRQENAELFSTDNLDRQLTHNLNKLMRNQLPGGGWDWYGRYGYSRYITDYLIAGFYKLQRLGVELSADADKMLAKAIRQSDKAQEERYQQYLERLMKDPETQFYFSEEDVHYLYARSFAGFDSVWLKKPYVQNLLNLAKMDIYKARYMRQAEMALVLHRFGMSKEADNIVEDLRYYAFQDKDLGMYWGENPGNRRKDWRIGGYYPWYEAPVERQAMLIEAFAEISPREEELTAMKQWLLLQKEGNSWKNTKASSAAVYALLLNAPSDLLAPATSTITVGGETFTPAQDESAEAGTGYLKHVWTAEEMTPQLADIAIHTDSVHPAFGSFYWQYLEVPDQVTASGDGLTIRRTLLHRPAEGDGKHAEPVTEGNPLRVGERITVRLVIHSDRELEFVHVKDPRTAAFEPVNIHERRGGSQGVWWTETPRDAAEHFFLNRLPQGTLIIEYDLYVTQTGTFSHAPATIECMYAPGHRGQSDGERVTVQ